MVKGDVFTVVAGMDFRQNTDLGEALADLLLGKAGIRIPCPRCDFPRKAEIPCLTAI
jgi:hypothetical protein